MRFKIVFLVLCLCFLSLTAVAQKHRFKIHTVAFYNLENLFDSINDPNTLDEYSPIMNIKTNRSKAYLKKVKHMARVISEIGYENTGNAPAIIGICEVENRSVIEDLIRTNTLINKGYNIIHFDSPDARGIDVALLYKDAVFTPTGTVTYTLNLHDENSTKHITTRDQLLVSGMLENDPIHIIVNHWPSRRGGASRSESKRLAAATLNKHIIDSLQQLDPYAKIITMGDLNDNPIDSSLKSILKTTRKRSPTSGKALYNPFENYYKNGIGTTAYRDNWSLFDQIILSQPLLLKDYNTFRYYRASIFNKAYLITASGKYKGYPYRSWNRTGFSGGYSDHFPVYIQLIKAID